MLAVIFSILEAWYRGRRAAVDGMDGRSGGERGHVGRYLNGSYWKLVLAGWMIFRCFKPLSAFLKGFLKANPREHWLPEVLHTLIIHFQLPTLSLNALTNRLVSLFPAQTNNPVKATAIAHRRGPRHLPWCSR